jgi:hypothetical protein
MSTQPEALQLAEAFERSAIDHEPDGWPAFRQSTLSSAATELRRLHAVNEELLEVLVAFCKYVQDQQMSTDGAVTYSTTAINHWAFLARAAIAKAGGEA